MTEKEIEVKLRELFELNFEYIKLEGGVPFTLEIKDEAWRQVLFYFRKLRTIAEKVTETEVKLTLPNQKTPEGRTFSIEGVVDIVKEDDEVWMYDIKTHEAEFIKANKNYYQEQLNVYSHIWENIRGNHLDETAIIATPLPTDLRKAILEGDAARQKVCFEKWDPLIPLERDAKKVSATIKAFGEVVDRIEAKDFAPPSATDLEQKVPGTTRRFATQVCRNCDARFSCGSFRQYAAKSGARGGKFDFSKYLNELAEPLEQEEWLTGNLNIDAINAPVETRDSILGQG